MGAPAHQAPERCVKELRIAKAGIFAIAENARNFIPKISGAMDSVHNA